MANSAIALGEVLAALALAGTIIVSQISLHIKITRIATIMDRLILSDWPHLVAKIDNVRADLMSHAITATTQDARIVALEKCMD